jgi:hypothetical protein
MYKLFILNKKYCTRKNKCDIIRDIYVEVINFNLKEIILGGNKL